MEEVSTNGRDGIHADSTISEGRNLWACQPNEARASVSIPSNIAEGHGRLNTGEYKQFLGIARGSNFELQTQLEIAKAVGIGDLKLLNETEELSHEIGKMIFGILERIKAKAS